MKTLNLEKPGFSASWWVTFPPFLLFILPLLQGKSIFWGLPSLQFIPWRHYAWTILRQGQIPLWNSLNGLGAPLIANYQLAFFYPPAFPLFLLDEVWGPAGLAWGFTLLIPIHLAWGAWGVSRLLGELGVGNRGKIIAGIAFGMSGYLVARGSFFSVIWAAVWIPWILIFIEKTIHAANRKQLVNSGRLLAICLTMQLLAGHAQLTWYGLIYCVIWTLFRLVSPKFQKINLKRIVIAAGFAAFAVTLAAIQLLPTFEYLQQSQRASAFDFAHAMDYSFSPLRLIGFIAPEFFGNPGFSDFWGYASYWEDAIYIGLIPFILALTTLLWLRGNRIIKKEYVNLARLLWATAFLGLLFALGGNTPIFPWLFQHVPTFDIFQAPARWMIWSVLSLIILAGLAADQIDLTSKSAKVFLNLATFAGVVLAGTAALASLAWGEWEAGIFRGLMMFGIFAGGSAFIARRLPTNAPAGWWGVVAIAWIVIDIASANWLLNPTISASEFNANNRYIASNQIPEDTDRLWISPETEYEMKFSWFFDFSDFNNRTDWTPLRSSFLPNLNLLDELSMVNNFDPLVPARFAAWSDFLTQSSETERTKWLAWAGATHEIEISSSGGQAITFTPVANLPRFDWTSCVISTSTPAESLDLVAQRMNSMDDSCIVVEGISSHTAPSSAGGIVRLISEKPNNIVLISESEHSGWVVVRDSWFPGWVAKIDGNPAETFPAEYLFKAISVSAGMHRIELEYKPASFTIGWLVSLVSWMVLGLSWLFQSTFLDSDRFRKLKK